MTVPKDQDELTARAATGELTAEESARLLEACRADERLAAECARLLVVERLLHAVESDPGGILAAREVVARIRHEQAPVPAARMIARVVEAACRTMWMRRLSWAGAVAAAVVLAFVGAWYWNVHTTRPVATIVREEGVRWTGAEPEANLYTGARLIAKRGLFELRFADGTNVVVEGPAEIEIEGPGRAFLHNGRAVARVPEKARGFTLNSPRGPLVDLGTEFGVAVTAEGNTEVHVLDGIVEASLNQASPVRLYEKEALRATVGSTERLSADEGAFVTTLPPITHGAPDFIHWSFDERRPGRVFVNTGRMLGRNGDTALFSRFLKSAGISGPAVIPGKFGQGLNFDGVNDFAESPFPGIVDGKPRTIAFWVRVPRNFSTTQGYGIISWGDIQSEGGAWQISPNPSLESGEVGRLRVGTKSGYVIGTTDLRDDQWHHCAIVMYGGARPNIGTHVLLYLDGELESCPRKVVQEIATKASPSHGVWLGRNLAFYEDTIEMGESGRFFRGAVDEVYIFDGALSQRDIETLMRDNRPPEGE